MTISRRKFIKSGLGTMSMYMAAQELFTCPSASAQTSVIHDSTVANRAKTLIMLQLCGGNDGLNTVVPYGIESYYKSRPHLSINPEQVLKINDQIGLHPALDGLYRRYAAGEMAIVQGVGYPNPKRSHYRSAQIWHTAEPEKLSDKTWMERYLSANQISGDRDLLGVMNQETENYLEAESSSETFFQRLSCISERIIKGMHCPIYTANLAGFDTHDDQLPVHNKLLGLLSTGIDSLYTDLSAAGLNHDVTIFVFSEFGRKLAENATYGSEHGTAAPCFVIGTGINGGIYGAHPSLTDLADGQLKYTVDLRDVIATLLEGCLRADSRSVLGQQFEAMRFV